MAVHHTMCFVFTILIICNAVLYPSIFSSVFSTWFGSDTGKDKEKIPDMPPHMRSNPKTPGTTRRMEMERTAQRNMKQSGDPASYFAQQKQESSKGRGVMGSVLPVYAVGIVVYFAYIMYRIFLKEKSSKPSEPDGANIWDKEKDDSALLYRVQQEQLQKHLSEQLRADNYNGIKTKKTTKPSKSKETTKTRDDTTAAEGSPDEVTALKKRLEDTERSMQRMMDMMNNMGIAMSQVTEQLTGTVPAGLAKSLNSPAQDDDDGTDDDDAVSNQGGERSNEEFSNSDIDSDEEFPPESELPAGLLTKTFQVEDNAECSTDEGEGEVEVIGEVGSEGEDAVRRRFVSAIGGES